MNAESDEIDIFQFHRTRDKLQAENFTMGLIFDTESHEETVIREKKRSLSRSEVRNLPLKMKYDLSKAKRILMNYINIFVNFIKSSYIKPVVTYSGRPSTGRVVRHPADEDRQLLETIYQSAWNIFFKVFI